jgi:hypothetical protein
VKSTKKAMRMAVSCQKIIAGTIDRVVRIHRYGEVLAFALNHSFSFLITLEFRILLKISEWK